MRVFDGAVMAAPDAAPSMPRARPEQSLIATGVLRLSLLSLLYSLSGLAGDVYSLVLTPSCLFSLSLVLQALYALSDVPFLFLALPVLLSGYRAPALVIALARAPPQDWKRILMALALEVPDSSPSNPTALYSQSCTPTTLAIPCSLVLGATGLRCRGPN